MANGKEIKNRIQSVKDTQKITNAMYLIASTKMQRARRELDQTRPYFNALRTEIQRIFHTDQVENRYFYPADSRAEHVGTCGCLVITADKGLAGAYNQNVLKEAERLLAEYPQTKLFVVGEYGRQYFNRRNIPIERSFFYTAQNPTLRRAREIAYLLLEMFDGGTLDEIDIIYTDLENGMTARANRVCLLPFHRSDVLDPKEQWDSSEHFVFEPSVEKVLKGVVSSYLSGFLYSALVDSFCSEQNARMNAMNAANKNAEELLGELTIQYNRVRQAAITQEMTEVSAGAKAQLKKRRKEVNAL